MVEIKSATTIILDHS